MPRHRSIPTVLPEGIRDAMDRMGARSPPNVAWAARVTGRSPAEVAHVLETMGGEEIDAEDAIARALQSTGRTYYAQFPAPLELYAIVRLTRPDHVVESGVSSGLSTAHILMALRRNGTGVLHSMDLPAFQRAERRRRGELSWSIPRGKDSGWAVPAPLKRRWDLRQGPSERLLPALLKDLPRLDLFCHDSPWTPAHLAFEFQAIRKRLHPGSVVVADNTDHNPAAVEELARTFGTRAWRRGRSSLIGLRVP